MNIHELKSYLKSLPRLADKDREKRIKRAKEDFFYFVQTYLKHHTSTEETSDFRNFVYKNIKDLTEKETKLLFLSYRGSAKTTLLARLFPIWQVIRGKANYPIIISNTIDVAQNSLEFLKTEFEENANLIGDFEIIQGDTWQTEEFTLKVANNPVKFKAFGSGKKIRGENYLGHRPDLIILDDIENDENVQSKTQRDKLEKWFTKAIMWLPDRTKHSNIIIVGTLLHHDAVLKRLSMRKDFKTFSFPLVKSFPKHLDAWQALYEEPNRAKAYMRFLDNKKFYLKDFRLDDEKLNHFEIMMSYFEDKDSFYSEFQNEPLSSDSAILADFKTYDELPNDLVFALAVDPSLGKNDGDYTGIAVVGRSNKEKRFYVVFAKGYRIKPSQVIKKILEIFCIYHPKYVVIETIAFQEFLKDKLKEEALEQNIYLPVVEVKHRTNKEIRLSALSPYVQDGTILFNKNEHQLIEQLLTFPKAQHDDILDAVEMAFKHLAVSSFDYRAFKEAINHKREKLKRLTL